MQRTLKSLIAVLFLIAGAFAASLTGTVKNLTTGKPAAGDTVELLALQQGMQVQASTKTDASGSFSFNLNDANVPHLLRATHDGVTFFNATGPLPPGTTTATLEVCDSGTKIDGISTTVNVLRLQSDGSTLQAIELIAIQNNSKPPRALKGDKTYEFNLPENAQIDQALVRPPGGMPISTTATPEGKSGKYAFNFALKPGETQFEVAYHLPYSGEATFAPKLTGDVQHFVVMTPKSMTFEPKSGAKFSLMDNKASNVQVATNATATSNLAFKISGTGQLQEEDQQGGGGDQQASAGGGSSAIDNRPGGGLGAPIDAPDPLQKYRVVLLAGLGIVLVCGAVFVVSRTNQQLGDVAPPAPVTTQPASSGGRKKTAATPPAAAAPVAPAPQPASGSSNLLEGLKDELFQLEIEKEQGRISAEEYESTKAALNQTLRRALQRKPS